MNSTTMPCPVCKAPLTINAMALLGGEKASCAGCGTAISLEPGSAMREAMVRFGAARDEVQQVVGKGRRRG